MATISQGRWIKYKGIVWVKSCTQANLLKNSIARFDGMYVRRIQEHSRQVILGIRFSTRSQ